MTDISTLPSRDRFRPLRHFVFELTDLVDRTSEERLLLIHGSKLLAELIETYDWLPESHATPDPERYTQYLLYRDPSARFSVVSFVWGPGQTTPIHDHTVWGLVGVLKGAEVAERYAFEGSELRLVGRERLEAGAIDLVSPSVGDLHRVSNALSDAVSISIHVYGANIGDVQRSTYDAAGRSRPFVSGYSAAPELPL